MLTCTIGVRMTNLGAHGVFVLFTVTFFVFEHRHLSAVHRGRVAARANVSRIHPHVYLFIYLLLVYWMTPSVDWITWSRIIISRARWPRGLRRGSAAARLLGLRVRITPGTWMSLLNARYCQVEISVTGWSLVQRSLTEWVSAGVIECD